MKLALAAVFVILATTRSAFAFCGFYVAGSDQQLANDATQVTLMRRGTRTVLAMQNDYKGPPDAFAMIVPVPVVLHEDDVKTLPKDVFAHVEQMGAPRLVEYWEQDPCAQLVEEQRFQELASLDFAMRSASNTGADVGVTIEAKFVVGEYQIVILSAKDSTGLDTWLRQEHYNVPAGAEPLLRPYVESGMKFFVAKVDPAKVKFENGRAALSPLRFHYDADEFALPIRLGLANSSGTQDLIVNIFADNRYEVANYKNVTIPTNLDLEPSMKDKFGAFYAALFDRTLETNKGAIVTEYAWQAMGCDPCPGPTLASEELQLLGGDVVDARGGYNLVLTRLHARYGKELSSDLVFKAATPITGGREVEDPNGQLEHGAVDSSYNNFQARYAIRHPWTGPIRCVNAHRGVWGGPWPGVQVANDVKAATNLAFAQRDVKLASAVIRGIPELGVRTTEAQSGCGCQSADASGGLVMLGLLLLRTRSRRRCLTCS